MAKKTPTISMALLSGIGEQKLKTILIPIKPILEEKSLWWETVSDFKPRELTNFLRSSRDLPKEVSDALYVIGTLAKPDYESFVMDAFLNTAVDVPSSNIKAAVQLWDMSPQECSSIIVRQDALRGRKYSYYRPKIKDESVLQIPTEEMIESVRKEMSDWFFKNNKGTYTLILCHEVEEWIYFSIFHGGLIKRDNDVNSGEVGVVTYRPELSDFVRINKTTGVLGIHLSVRNKTVENYYVKAFNQLFLPDTSYIARNCYTLEPLKDENKIQIVGELGAKISAFSLKKVFLQFKDNEVCIKGDNLKTLWKDWNLRIGMFKKADFDVVFNGDDNPKKLTIIPPYSVDFPERYDDEDLNVLLCENGFLIDEEDVPEPIQEDLFHAPEPVRMGN